MINYADKIKIIKSVRESCLKKYPEDIDILRTSREERLGLFQPQKIEEYLLLGLESYENEPIDNIAGLIATPRLLKMALRHTLMAWNILHGEVDFDDLLVANTIKFAAPEAHDFLLNNIYEIRSLQFEHDQPKLEKRKDKLLSKWKQISESVLWEANTVFGLIEFLFPFVGTGAMIGTAHGDIPQGVRHHTPTDYWVRATTVDLPQSQVRDQEVIHAIKAWEENERSKTYRDMELSLALYQDEEFASKFEQLSNYFLNGQSFRLLTSELFRHVLSNDGVTSNSDSTPSFFVLWRLSIRKPIENNKHTEWVLNEIRQALPISFRFANDIYHYWNHNSETTIDTREAKPEIRNPFIDHVKQITENNPQKLIDILDPTYPYNIYHFSVLFSSEREGGPGTFEPSEWTWLADVLLDAALIDPKTVLPHLVTWIIDVSDAVISEERKYKFKEDWAKILFKDRLHQAMELLIEDIDYSNLSEKEKEKMAFAQQTAKKWLENQTNLRR